VNTRTLFSTLSITFWLLGLGSCTLGTNPNSTITGTLLILTGSTYFIGLAILNALAAIAAKRPPPK
jgi:hypothetical protein